MTPPLQPYSEGLMQGSRAPLTNHACTMIAINKHHDFIFSKTATSIYRTPTDRVPPDNTRS